MLTHFYTENIIFIITGNIFDEITGWKWVKICQNLCKIGKFEPIINYCLIKYSWLNFDVESVIFFDTVNIFNEIQSWIWTKICQNLCKTGGFSQKTRNASVYML